MQPSNSTPVSPARGQSSAGVVASASTVSAPSVPATIGSDQKTARILARTIFRDMKSYGLSNEKIIDVASELIGLVTAQLKESDPPRHE